MARLVTAGNQELRVSQCGCKPYLLVATCCKSGLIDWINVQCYILERIVMGKIDQLTNEYMSDKARD